ncbi:MAG: hypothetical protein AB1425_09265 [Actinomycetota bacterium]
MNLDGDRLPGDSFVLVSGALGCAGGGFWLACAFEVLAPPAGKAPDAVAPVVAGVLTASIAWTLRHAGGRLALFVGLALAAVAAIIGPAMVS